tara:strand:- start:524 stop:826 length:303 start_codon:yes stop_codon:yes gene_type:complete
MSLDYKTIIEKYCETGKLSDEEVDFLERQHLKTMSVISEVLSPSIAHWKVCEACHLEKGSLWITCNASILDRIRPVKTGKPRAHSLFDSLCQYKLYRPRT